MDRTEMVARLEVGVMVKQILDSVIFQYVLLPIALVSIAMYIYLVSLGLRMMFEEKRNKDDET